ncbi:MAG: GNAT family N-acetyltransferase [Chloroflexi bacterium]|nr:MAG: GNAT family N-acetyltransferase [Chloroflexota bacterium]
MPSEILVRPVTEADLVGVRTLFYRCYGKDYPYKEFYDDEWLKRSIYQDSYLFLLAELNGKVVGTASVYFEVGAYADLVGEFGRLAVDPDYRGRGVGTALMKARLAFAEKRLHFGLSECRTAHPFAQRISEKFGLRPVGFLPQKVLLDQRESLVMMAKLFGPARQLRANNPRVIPEVYLLGQLALENLGLESDLIAVEDVDGYPIGTGFEVEELTEDVLPHLLRIERGRLSRRHVFGNLQLSYGLFLLEARNSRYLVAREGGKIVGAIGFTLDYIGRSIKVIELIDLRDDVAGFLLKELDRWAREVYKAEYLEITVSAYWPDIQRTLSNLGFVPVAYCPSFVFHEVERLDTIKMAKLYVPLDIDNVALTDASRAVFELVRAGFEEKRLGIIVNETTRHMAIFQNLEEGELAKIAGLCQVTAFRKGETILRAGDEGEVFYMVMEGKIDIYAADGETIIGRVHEGDFLGEIALVAERPFTATAVAATNVKLIALKHQDFMNLIHKHPRIGMQVMRNIAISLGEKLRTIDEKFSKQNNKKRPN